MIARRLLRCVLSMPAALVTQLAMAQTPDLTRPPPAVLQPPTRSAGPAANAPAEIPEAAPTSRIIVTGRARSFVVVEGGYTVYVGDTYNGARLLDIRRDGAVWLRNGVREIDYGGGRVAKLAPEPSGTGTQKPITSNKQNNATSGGSPR